MGKRFIATNTIGGFLILVALPLAPLLLFSLHCGEKDMVSEKMEEKFIFPEFREVDVQDLCPTPEPRIISFQDKVFVAVGYDLATISMVLTSEGKVIIDTGSSPEKARIVKEEFDKISNLPVRAVIYTHSHIDHTGGASVWVDTGEKKEEGGREEGKPEIWATENLTYNFFSQYGVWLRLQSERARMQFGFDLPESELPCFSIGGRLSVPKEFGFVKPTHTFSGRTTFRVGELTFELVEAHGETKDQLFVWINELGVLFSGDNFYLAFPNLYSVRGSSERPVEKWIESIDEMRRRDPIFLVSGHTLPIEGREKIRQVLMDYRDAIAYIWQKMVKLANKGYYMDDIAYHVKLPDNLSQRSYLRETYGKVEWSLKGFYSWKIGWFDGMIEKLYSLPTTFLAMKEIEVLGGVQRVVELAKGALAEKNLRLALFWLSKLRNAGKLGEGEAKELYLKVISALARSEENFIARAWLLEEKMKVQKGLDELPSPEIPESMVENIPIDIIFQAMRFRLKDGFENAKVMVKFVFPDINKVFTVSVRRGVVQVVDGEPLPGEGNPDVVLEIDSLSYKKIVFGITQPGKILDKIRFQGDIQKLFDFMKMFDTGIR